MLEGRFRDSGRNSRDVFAAYRFFLKPKREESLKIRETRAFALSDFDVQEANLFLVYALSPRFCCLGVDLNATKGAKMLLLASAIQLQRSSLP